jgi:hypothetical protein
MMDRIMGAMMIGGGLVGLLVIIALVLLIAALPLPSRQV